MADKGSLSDKERALIEAARRELAAKTATPPQSPPLPAAQSTPGPSTPTQWQVPPAAAATRPQAEARPQAQSPPPADAPVAAPDKAAQHAARIAALMAAEREEFQRRRQVAKRWGIHFPMAIFALALIWLALRQLR